MPVVGTVTTMPVVGIVALPVTTVLPTVMTPVALAVPELVNGTNVLCWNGISAVGHGTAMASGGNYR